jgi:hypothetical protein
MFRATLLSDSLPEAPASFRLYLLSLMSLLFYTPRVRQSVREHSGRLLAVTDIQGPRTTRSFGPRNLGATHYVAIL